MLKILNYIKAQDKIKLMIYLFSFTTFVAVNNIYNNIVSLIAFQKFCFYDLGVFCKVIPNIYFIVDITVFNLCKIGLFFILIMLLKKENKGFIKTYFTEVIISYFLFDFGFLLSQAIDVINILPRTSKWYFFSSPQSLITPAIGWPLATVIAVIWCFLLWKVLRYYNNFNPEWLLKRCFISGIFSLFIYMAIRYCGYLWILKPPGMLD